MDPLSGRTIGGITLGPKLGAGGMGSVYAGTDTEAGGAPRAIKLLSLASHEHLQVRFQREARIGHRLRHPLLVGVHRYGVSGDYQYMVMDLVEGEDLGHVLLRTGAMAWPLAAAIGRDIARALEAVHAEQMVHRDLKPGNVLLDANGRIRLADFGLASWREGPADLPDGVSLTRTGDVFGTPQYMAPEQFEDAKNAGPRADLYSLGVLLFEALAGRPPFQASTPHSLARLHKEVPPPPLETLAADTPPELCALVARLLAKDPADRPPDAGAVAGELARIAARGQAAPLTLETPGADERSVWRPDPSQGETVRLGQATPRPARRRGAIVSLGLGLLAAAGAWAAVQGTFLRLRLATKPERVRYEAIEQALLEVSERPAAWVEALEAYRRDFGESGWLAGHVEEMWTTPLRFREGAYLIPRDGAHAWMVRVRGGTYEVGHPSGDGTRLAARRTVKLAGYLIDRDEVSRARYERFLAEWQAAGAVHRCGDPQADHGRPLQDRSTSPSPDGPVVGVTPWDAREFALFLGRRLPTEEEWEVAAAWDPAERRSRDYPWGNRQPNAGDQRYFANLAFAEWGTFLAEEQRFVPQCAPSRSFEFDCSPLKVYDMAGNAAEWCQGALPLPGKQPVRGGSFLTDDPDGALLAARREHDPREPPPREVGFRTVLPYERP